MATSRSRSRSRPRSPPRRWPTAAPAPHGGMHIFVSKLDGARVALNVEPSDKVMDVKLKIEDEWDHRPIDQRLTFGQRVLSETDARTLSELFIGDKAELILVLREVAQIIVKTRKGQIVSFEVEPHAPLTPPPEREETMDVIAHSWLQDSITALSKAMWCGLSDDFIGVPAAARRP